jgi:TatD DNase family protein
MLMLIDTHAHLDEQAFDVDRDEVLVRARQAGVEAVLTIGITADTSRAAVNLAEQYDDVFAVVGIQPNYASQVKAGDWETIEQLAAHPRVVGIGETGLDRYWDYAPLDLQAEYFDRHLLLSQQIGKPFVVHCRNAEQEVVDQLQRWRDLQGGSPLAGVMHSFCGDAQTAAACLQMGLHLSFAGMLTYKKNVALRAVAADVPHDRLLIETDAPYLAPHEARESKKKGGLGIKRNEPALVRFTAACLAEQLGLTFDEVGRITTENARRLFGLPTASAAGDPAAQGG